MRGSAPDDTGGYAEDDRVLVQRAAAGDTQAFEALYRRHAPAAHRVAFSVAGNPDDAADAVAEAFTRILAGLPQGRLLDASAFRPYLMAATRNAAIDHLRRKGRLKPTDVVDLDRPAPTAAGPSERMVSGEDSSMVVEAFRDLPERWRSVLWLTEIEGIPPREAGELLGLSANGASQLAVRARAGLRDRYLQAHVREAAQREQCRFTLEHLGAYVGGGLAPRDIAKVDQHLAGCDPCCQARDELEDLGTSLRRSILPIPLVLGGAAIGHWAREAIGTALASGGGPAAVAGAGAGAAAGSTLGGGVRSSLGAVHKAVAGACAGVLAAGVIAASTVTPASGPHGAARPRPAAQQAAPELPRSDQPPAVVDVVLAHAFGGRLPSKRAGGPGALAAPAEEQARGEEPGPGPGAGPDEPQAPGAPGATPVVQAGAGGRFGSDGGGVTAGVGDGSCTGVTAGAASTGCSPPVPTDDGLTVSTGGQALPPQTISAP